MLDRYEWPGGLARFTLVDMRELDGEPLLASPQPGDNILAILTRLSDQRAAVHQIVRKIADLERPQAVFYAESLLGLAGLRGLRSVIAEELRKNMAFDFVELLAENEVLEPYFRKAREEGLQAGRQEGQHEGQLGFVAKLNGDLVRFRIGLKSD
jgi:hypothetical protein